MKKNSFKHRAVKTAGGQVVFVSIVVVALVIMTAGCKTSAPDENADNNTLSRIKRLETRVAAIEFNGDTATDREKKFERFMEESERRQSEMQMAIVKLQEQLKNKAPSPEAAASPGNVVSAQTAPPVADRKVKLPAAAPAAPAAEPTRYHEVQKGETVYSISRQYNIEPAVLRKLNSLESDVIVPGQRLRLN